MTMPTTDWNGVELRWHGTMLDGSPAQGSLVITSDTPRWLDDNGTQDDAVAIFSVPIEVPIVNGYASRVVPATDDPDITPTGGTYTIREVLKRGAGKSITIEVPLSAAGSGIDLTRAIPTGPSAGTAMDPVERSELNDMFTDVVRSNQVGVGYDDDGILYYSNSMAFADAVPILLDEDGVPYVPAGAESPTLVGRGVAGGLAPLDNDLRIPDAYNTLRLAPARVPRLRDTLGNPLTTKTVTGVVNTTTNTVAWVVEDL